MNTQTLNPVKMHLANVDLVAYDCGDRWNGFVVPLFTAAQSLWIGELFEVHVNLKPSTYVSEKGEKLYQIESGYCFELSE